MIPTLAEPIPAFDRLWKKAIFGEIGRGAARFGHGQSEQDFHQAHRVPYYQRTIATSSNPPSFIKLHKRVTDEQKQTNSEAVNGESFAHYRADDAGITIL
jgi:hypothetical protein